MPWASFADALTGLLFVFILMSMNFAYRLHQQEEAADRRESEALRELEQYRLLKAAKRSILDQLLGGATEGAGGQSRAVASCLMQKTDLNGHTLFEEVATDREEQRVALRLPGSQAWFEACGSDLRTTDHVRVELVTSCVVEFIEKGGLKSPDPSHQFRLRVLVEGHTDTDKATRCPTRSNWKLSASRSAAFVERMFAPGSTTVRLRQQLDEGVLDIVPAGLEATAPARRDICDTPAGAADVVCTCLRENAWNYRACTAHLAGDETLGERVRAWGNSSSTFKDKNRRVGLRFEVVDRLELEAAP